MPQSLLVSCLCLTRNRREWLPRAIECFQAQTYPNRELIILADSARDLVYPDDPRVQLYIPKDKPEWKSIGAKRNAACTIALGELLCNFDDDDWSYPDRIEDQVQRLRETGKSVSVYRNLRFTDGETVWINTNWPCGFGSSHCFTRAWWEEHPYPDLNESEDLHFLAAALKAKQCVVTDCARHLLASNHAANTSPRLIGEGWIDITAQYQRGN